MKIILVPDCKHRMSLGTPTFLAHLSTVIMYETKKKIWMTKMRHIMKVTIYDDIPAQVKSIVTDIPAKKK